MRIDGQAPPEREWQAYCDRLREITAAGGQLKLIQIYTIAAHRPRATYPSMSDEEVDRMVDFVRSETGLHVAGFYGASV